MKHTLVQALDGSVPLAFECREHESSGKTQKIFLPKLLKGNFSFSLERKLTNCVAFHNRTTYTLWQNFRISVEGDISTSVVQNGLEKSSIQCSMDFYCTYYGLYRQLPDKCASHFLEKQLLCLRVRQHFNSISFLYVLGEVPDGFPNANAFDSLKVFAEKGIHLYFLNTCDFVEPADEVLLNSCAAVTGGLYLVTRGKLTAEGLSQV